MHKITYRHPAQNELLPACRVMASSYRDLQARSGRKLPAMPDFKETPSAVVHMFKTDRNGCWVAFAGKKMVGYGQALMRGRQWYLANLFVETGAQNRGVGRELLRRCVSYGRKKKADSFALCTFPYNEAAMGLYTSFGMMPRNSIFEMAYNVEKIPTIRRTGLRIENGDSYDSILRINRLEKKIRRYPRLVDLKFFASEPKIRDILDFYDGSRWVGYSFIHQNTLIGPAGTIAPRYLPLIVTESFRRCIKNGSKKVMINCGASNREVYSRLKSLGFSIEFLPVFLSTKPYGDFSRYIPAHLAIF
jgi:ribosomal protein S18 acetylase RimI-like enzyme